jgi:AcrR family transcriptional regulator
MIAAMADKERADAARNRQAILAAAGALFDGAADPVTVTMDDVAAAAGVGKGTLFRRFGDRAGLLRAVFQTRMAALGAAIETGPPPLGPGTPPAERILALVDAFAAVKLDNRPISRALEHLGARAERGSLLDTPNYQWAHALVTGLLEGIAGDRASWYAHVLLSLTRIDLIDHLVSAEGWADHQVRDEIAALARAVLAQAAGNSTATV